MAVIATLTLPEIMAQVQAHEHADLPRLIASGGEKKLRVGIFALTEDEELILLVDVFPANVSLAKIAQEVLPVLMGRWDARDTGRWSYAWTVGTPDWQLWSRADGRSFWVDDDLLHRAGPKPALAIDQIAAVQTWASPGWYEQGAEVRLEDETTVILAQTTCWAARLDPAYSFDDLTTDLKWAEHLGRDLATLLHVPVGEAIPSRDA